MERRPGGGAPIGSGQCFEFPIEMPAAKDSTPPDSWQPLGEVAARVVRARLVEHLHGLGPRATFEFLDELARSHEIGAEVDALLANYRELTPQIVAALGARDIPPPPLHEVPR